MTHAAPEFAGAAFAVVLGFAAAIAAMSAASAPQLERAYLRFAAGLAAALAIAVAAAALMGGSDAGLFADAVTLLVAALASASLALAAAVHFARAPASVSAAAILIVACVAGLAGAATGSALLGLAPLMVSAIAMAALAGRAWRRARKPARLLGLSAAAILAAAAAYMSGGAEGRTGFVLFFAAGLLGVALAIARASDSAFEKRRGAGRRDLFIGGKD